MAVILGGYMLHAAVSEVSLKVTIITLVEFSYIFEFLKNVPLEEFVFDKELSPNFAPNIKQIQAN